MIWVIVAIIAVVVLSTIGLMCLPPIHDDYMP
jgi:hypothetical protein